MKILLAPSETKKSGGEQSFDISSLLFDTLLPHRTQLLHKYINILQIGDMTTLSQMFGLKKESDILYYKKDIIYELTTKAINRYTGVAFDYIDYKSLTIKGQEYIDEKVIIFSNLWGPIRASDQIPDYKLKQSQPIDDIKVEKFYSQHSTKLLDEYLADEEILDLRSGFYDKFYKPTKPYTSLKFIKDTKVVSHWAKAYRGIVLKEIAQNNIDSIDKLIDMPIKNLSIQKITTQKNKTEIIYNIG